MPSLMEIVRERQEDGTFRGVHVQRNNPPRGVRIQRFISDPGHSWVSVARDEILRLGLSRELSGTMTPSRLYLSSDDMNVYLERIFERGERFFYREGTGHNDNGANLRDYGSYDPRFVETPIEPGRQVRVSGERGWYVCQVLTVDQRKGLTLGHVLADGRVGPAALRCSYTQACRCLLPSEDYPMLAAYHPEKGLLIGSRWTNGPAMGRGGYEPVWHDGDSAQADQYRRRVTLFQSEKRAHEALSRIAMEEKPEEFRLVPVMVERLHDSFSMTALAQRGVPIEPEAPEPEAEHEGLSLKP